MLPSPVVPPPPAPRRLETRRGPVELVDDGEGPPVLCLHGAMGGWDQSLLLGQTVGAPGLRYLAPSRPGYLGTPMASGHSPEEQADLCAAALDALGVPAAVMMAVSGGGPPAIHFALRHPSRCRALVLVSTLATRMEGRLPLSFRLLPLLARFPGFIDRRARAAGRDPERAARASIPDAATRARTLADPIVGPLFRELLASTAHRVPERLEGTFNDVRISRACEFPLEALRLPTLVVHGTADRLLPFERHGAELARRIPGAALVRAEGGDHVAIYTHHDVIQPRVAAFLARHAS